MAISPCGEGYYNISPQGQELVHHGTLLFPAAFYHDDLERMNVPWHWHEELEVIYVSSGETVICAGLQKYQLHEGQAVFLNSNVLHACKGKAGTNCRYHSIVFHPRLISGGSDTIYWQNYMRPLIASGPKSVVFDGSIFWHREAQDAIERAWQEGAHDAPGFELRVRNALSDLIGLLVSQTPATVKPISPKLLRDGTRIRQMLQFIERHYGETVTIADIASSASVSESECLRCFRSIIGMSPIQYVKQFRIQRACELLSSSEEKIGTIASLCGFDDTSYFTRAFREAKGITPKEYRNAAAPGEWPAWRRAPSAPR